MKKHLFMKSLLIAIGLLIASINTAWAGDREVFIDLSEAPNWYTNPEVNHGTGSSYTVTAASSTGVTNLYKVTIPDTDNWEVCRDGGNNKLAWQAYNSGKNKVRVYNTGAGGCATNIVGSVSGGYIYFDNSVSNFETPLYFVIGHDHNYWGEDNLYTKSYVMTNVTGTNLYYVGISDTWADAEFFAVIGSSKDLSGTGWGSSSIGSKGDRGNTAAYTGPYSLNSGSTYLVTTASSGNGQPMTITYKGTSYSSLNTTHTVEQVLSINGGSTYSAATKSIATTVSVSARALTNNGISGTSTGTITSGNSSANCSALRQQTVTYSVTEATGYTFVGWYDGATQKSTNTSYSYTEAGSNKTITAKFTADQYTITLKVNDGTSSSVTQTATYGETAASRAGSLPTRSGYGFDGYWTAADGGTKVINKNGTWVSNVSGYTDSNGKWICTEAKTLHAHWLEVGYYMVGEFTGGDWNAIAANKFDNTTKKCTINVANHDDYSAAGWKSEFKICYVQANTVSAVNETLYGKNPQATIGKYNTSVSSLTSGSVPAILEELSYDGNYIFTLTPSPLGVSVQVPVVDQLQIYNSDPSGATGIANHNWGAPVSNIVSKSVTLAHKTTYQFKAVYDSEHYGYGTGDTYETLEREEADSTLLAKSTNNVKILTDVKGDYQFDFNIKTKKIKVTYPTRWQINYSIVTKTTGNGTETGTSGSLSAENDSDDDYAVSTGGYVANGNSVTFRAPAAKSGYTWRGWFSKNNPSNWTTDGFLSSDAAYTTTISAATTVYAIYSEDVYSVTIDSTSNYVASSSQYGGCVKVSGTKVGSVSNVGVDSYAELTAVPTNEAWRFKEWRLSASASLDDGYALTDNPVRINATATSQTVTAFFEPRYGLYGSRNDGGNTPEGMPGWTTSADFAVLGFTALGEGTGTGVNLQCTCELEPNRQYKFIVYDRERGQNCGATAADKTMEDGNNWKLNSSGTKYHVLFWTAGYGDYTFHITNLGTETENYPSIQIDRQASHKLTTLGRKVIYNASDATLTDASDSNGGTVSAKTNEGAGDGYTITPGQYFAEGSDVVFTAVPATGYEVEGWYSDASCETAYVHDGSSLSISGDKKTLTLSSLDKDVTVYVKFAEIMTTVTIAYNSHGEVQISDTKVTSAVVGVHTTYTVNAIPNTNYYFAGWTVPDGADFNVDDATEPGNNGSKSTTLRGLGAGTDGTITANFVELDKVYFRNWNEEANAGAGGTLWANVYVYFSITYENGDESTPCAKTNSQSGFKAQMTLESGNIYWAYVPRATTYNKNYDIAFSNTSVGTSYKFNSGEAVMRGDYRSGLSMFVPRHASSFERHHTTYYNGYWKHHNLDPGELSGYSIERYKGGDPAYEHAADNGADRLHFIVLNENKIQYSLRVDNVTDGFNNYMIYSDGGIHYVTYNSSVSVTGYDITTTNYKDIHMSEYNTGSPRFYITPTTQNIYTLTIDQSGDELKLTVDYPVAKGDYRIVHTYNSGGTKKAYSDIIKSADAATGVIASMYINTNSSPTLTLEKCTAITPVTWTAQTQGDVWSTHSGKFNKGNGVYQFDVTINTDASDAGSSINSIDNVGLYDGEFYIKTDIAPGGWTAWKANIMEKNSITFDTDDPKTYDYAFCHWVGNTTTNVKCVIANEYNIAVSDTLESDAILGGSSQTLPSAAHVRFSYNSTTNELKRTYLAVSGDDHLIMEGNTLSGPVYMIHNPSTHTNYDNNKATLDNLSNFTFGLDIEAREKARVRLSAKYNGTIQDLVGHVTSYGSDLTDANTVEIMGGDIKNTGYNTLHVSYDFKTNQLLSAWMAPESGNTPSKAINADVMIIRQEQGDARQITFSGSDNLSAVKKVYGVMKFTKSFILDNGESRYARDLYWISFPFDVRLSDAFGLGTYGTHWIIEYYDGKGRATNGFWADSESNWKFVTPAMREHGGEDRQGYILNANEGYILALDLDELGGESLVWDNGMTEAYLYFPSESDVNNIAPADSKEVPIDQVGYQCTINRATPDGDRRIKDSYWHCIGAPSYANVNHDVATEDPTLGGQESWNPVGLMYFYEWNTADNSLDVRNTSPQSFKAMHSYLVQYSSTTLTWANVNKAPASVAARLAETPDREYKLVLQGEERTEDQTFVRLTDETVVSNRFEFNYDLSKEYNAGRGNIWTVTADTVEVAGNSMPKPVQTTVVPVGVKVVANGEYTFSMPEGTNGEDVYLIDNAYGTRTNLGLMPYTVTLTAGTYDSRFALEFGPIQDAPTGIDEMSTVNYQLSTEEVRKVFVGGRLYIIRDGKVYDAAGQRVE